MPTTTTRPPARAERDQNPPDIATMRAAVDRLLDPDAAPEALPLDAAGLETLTLQLRGHIQLLLPEIEQAARLLPKASIPRYCLLACAGEARERLRAEPSERFGGAVGLARRLARALNALCDHYEQAAGLER
ncbi:DUF6415 family natural product biosynthesis protein [Streptomyces sp. CC219B]|uniref:DUF6415 family natural product biosynthesis protein n=1 Tax=Streptomyces sp. CC219B TaxID=3044574 RepID=UPI0024A90FDF|nr:DUF6415 family natural product biosynthesis protein [Streptomyces sp. CC219B]